MKDKAPKYMVMVKDINSDPHSILPPGYWYFATPTLAVAKKRMKQHYLPNRTMTLFTIALKPVKE